MPLPLLLPPGRRPMFPPVEAIHPRADGLVAVGGDLAPETLVEAYRKGLFPWDGRFPYPWYSPDPRCILEPGHFVARHALRKLDRQGRYRVSLDTRFREVMTACAVVPRPGQHGTWISPQMVDAYEVLHHRGVAHSVEITDADGRLVGGLYGLAMGRVFFGESMFAAARDASKIALWHLCRRAHAAGYVMIDCQQDTPHLRSLGAVLVSRAAYLARLDAGLAEEDGWPALLAAQVTPGV